MSTEWQIREKWTVPKKKGTSIADFRRDAEKIAQEEFPITTKLKSKYGCAFYRANGELGGFCEAVGDTIEFTLLTTEDGQKWARPDLVKEPNKPMTDEQTLSALKTVFGIFFK